MIQLNIIKWTNFEISWSVYKSIHDFMTSQWLKSFNQLRFRLNKEYRWSGMYRYSRPLAARLPCRPHERYRSLSTCPALQTISTATVLWMAGKDLKKCSSYLEKQDSIDLRTISSPSSWSLFLYGILHKIASSINF